MEGNNERYQCDSQKETEDETLLQESERGNDKAGGCDTGDAGNTGMESGGTEEGHPETEKIGGEEHETLCGPVLKEPGREEKENCTSTISEQEEVQKPYWDFYVISGNTYYDLYFPAWQEEKIATIYQEAFIRNAWIYEIDIKGATIGDCSVPDYRTQAPFCSTSTSDAKKYCESLLEERIKYQVERITEIINRAMSGLGEEK